MEIGSSPPVSSDIYIRGSCSHLRSQRKKGKGACIYPEGAPIFQQVGEWEESVRGDGEMPPTSVTQKPGDSVSLMRRGMGTPGSPVLEAAVRRQK